MIDTLLAYRNLLDAFAIHAILAYSQYIVLRAGVFSIATAGFASIGGYCAALAVTAAGLHPVIAVGLAVVLASMAGLLIALPLARLRGVFQAIATLAFVQIILSFAQNATGITNGALGINGIPKSATTAVLLTSLAVITYLLWSLSRSKYGRAFDAIRQDETVAVALGVSVVQMHLLAFVLSGFLGGLGGALEALHNYSITPEQFGFQLLVACLTFVILGGRRSVWGPLAGALILTLLPEVARPFKEYRLLVQGALLISVIVYLENGIVDTLIDRMRARRLTSPAGPALTEVADGAPVA